MKPIEADESESAEQEGPDAQTILEQGRQLCTIGESLIAAAKAMGAVDEGEGDVYEEEGGEAEPVAPKANPKNAAIILAIKKKLGKK